MSFPTPPSFRGALIYAGELLTLTCFYVALGRLGLAMDPVSGFATLVWPPSGVALLALLLGGYRLWPAIALGAFVTNRWIGAPPLVALAIAVGNTLEPVVGTAALRRIPGFRGSLDRFTEVIGLAVLAGMFSTAISATIGVVSLRLGGIVSAATFPRTWLAWWTGDLIGDLVIAPLLLTWTRGPRVEIRPAVLGEVAALGVVLFGGAVLLFIQGPDAVARSPVLQPYILVLPLTWTALRYGSRGAATGTFLVAVAAVWGTYTGHGAFVRASRADSLAALHVFLAAASLSSLILGAVVSEREQSRRELGESASLLRTIIDGALDAVFVKDRSGRYVIMNAVGGRLFGMAPEAVAGKDDRALFPAEEARLLREVDQEILRTGQPRTTETALTIGGTTRVFQTTKAPRRDDAGNVVGVIGVAREITARRAEEMARTWLAAIVESSADAIIGKTLDGTITSWNAAAERMYGYSPAEAIGQPIAMLVPQDQRDAIAENLERVRRGERIVDRETVRYRKDGTRVDVALTLSPIRDSAGTIVGASAIERDVGERRRAEEAHAALLDQERAARAKDEFLAVLSHELRTPLQSMLGWTQMLRGERRDERTLQRGLAIIERNAKAQAQLIEDLLDLSRIAAGKLRLEHTRVDLACVIESAVEAVKTAADAKSIRLDATIGPIGGETVGDADRLQQVVSNLLSNSVKFTPAGGHIGVRLERDGGAAHIIVDDTGCGIPAEFLPHVFDRFRQANGGTTRPHGGLGLGLAIVRHLVELHGGAVTAESPGKGQGATFTVTLPLAGVERPAVVGELVNDLPDTPTTPALLSGVRVLVVDDDADACELLETTLHGSGAEVHAVHSARAALGELASFHPDVVVSDIGMPEEDGYALIREMRARETEEGNHVPAIALTAFASHADREHALAMGYEAHVAKPASPRDIARTVARLAGRAA